MSRVDRAGWARDYVRDVARSASDNDEKWPGLVDNRLFGRIRSRVSVGGVGGRFGEVGPVAATQQVQEWLLRARDTGASVLLISEDLDEVMQLSDRIAVLYEGEIVGTVPAANQRILGVTSLLRSQIWVRWMYQSLSPP